MDIKLFCPNCAEQHIDEARPGICETCGRGESACFCVTFTAWLNPPHKSHRCNFCNHVWRPADVPTNGVRDIQSKGQRDGDAKPRAAKGWEAARSYEQRATELEARLAEAKQQNVVVNAQLANAETRTEQAEARLKEAEREREYERSWKEANAAQAEMLAQTVEKLGVAKSAAEARAEAAERDYRALRELFDSNPNAWYSQVEKAKADAERLRAALEAYPEWMDDDDPQAVGTMQRFVTCIVCGGGGVFNSDGKPSKRMPPTHKPDCARQAALSVEAGEGVKG